VKRAAGAVVDTATSLGGRVAEGVGELVQKVI
jgi:hypothetical protein